MNTSMTPEMLAKAVERLRALADETRIRIMMLLASGERNVSEISSTVEIAQPSVSKHIAILRHAGIVDSRREGNQTLCFIRDASVFDICKTVCSGVRQYHHQVIRAISGVPKETTNERKTTNIRRNRPGRSAGAS